MKIVSNHRIISTKEETFDIHVEFDPTKDADNINVGFLVKFLDMMERDTNGAHYPTDRNE